MHIKANQNSYHDDKSTSVITRVFCPLVGHAAYRDFNQYLAEYPSLSVCSYDLIVLRDIILQHFRYMSFIYIYYN